MSISKQTPTDERIEENMEAPHYDRGITPAETAARQEREGEGFMHIRTETDLQDSNIDEPADPDAIRTTDGYTVDKEGLVNNYAIEPEMYINEPGDLRAKAEAEARERAEALQALKEDNDETGKLTMEEDARGKGPGVI
ncbi:hypothetical protein [Phormidium nigroviride]